MGEERGRTDEGGRVPKVLPQGAFWMQFHHHHRGRYLYIHHTIVCFSVFRTGALAIDNLDIIVEVQCSAIESSLCACLKNVWLCTRVCLYSSFTEGTAYTVVPGVFSMWRVRTMHLCATRATHYTVLYVYLLAPWI